MINAMTYKGGYSDHIKYDDDDPILMGHLSGIKDIIGFHTESVAKLRMAFEEAVDSYLDACQKLGQNPNKPTSGKMMLRVDPEIHRAALVASKLAGKSLNQWAAEVFQKAVNMDY